MAKKKHIKLEYKVFLFIVLGILLLIMPLSFESSKQAGFISKWNEKYNRIEYMFSVINAHITDDMLISMKKAQSPTEREKLLLTLIKPYLRVDTENLPTRRYKPRYINGNRIAKDDLYYFDEFYFAENKTVLGIKDIKSQKNNAFFMMMFDINGIMPPNRWGRDIFGLNIYDGGKIEPFGYDLDMPTLANDCSDKGTGINCSYYYKIGGGFDE